MSEDEIPERTVVEMCALVQSEFARFGIPGQVQVTGTSIELISPQGKLSYPIGAWWRSWPAMDEAAKASNAAHLARQLKQVRNASRAPSQLPVARRDYSTLQFVLVMLAIGGAVAWFAGVDPRALMDRAIAGESGKQEDPGVERGSSAERGSQAAPEDRGARARRVCSATRTRALKGGSVGISDVDGWVVEIFLAKSGSSALLTEAPEMKRFVEEPMAAGDHKMTWPAALALVKVDTSDTVAQLRAEIWGEGEGAVSTLRVTLNGSLVDPFFDESQRGLVNGIADSLAKSLAATHAAVYARCSDSPVSAMGSWFWGKDIPHVSAALLYGMGMSAEPPHIASPFYRSPGKKETNHALSFENIRANTASLDQAGLEGLVGKLSGKVVPQGKRGVMLTFPFRDGSRAVRASRTLAGAVSLGTK